MDKRTIYNRKRQLLALQRRISLSRNKRLIGSELPVLVEGPSKETELLWEARLATQAPEIDGICYINDFGCAEPRPGEMRTLRVTEAHDYDLVGELIDGPERVQTLPDGIFAGSESSCFRLRIAVRVFICAARFARKKWRSDNPNMPFCSDRCRIIDLGNWAT